MDCEMLGLNKRLYECIFSDFFQKFHLVVRTTQSHESFLTPDVHKLRLKVSFVQASRPDFLTSCSDSLLSRSCVGLRLSSGILRRPSISFSHWSRPLLTLLRSLASSAALGSSGALFTVAEEEQSQVFFILHRPDFNQILMNTFMSSWSFFKCFFLCFYLALFLLHIRLWFMIFNFCF